MKFPVTLAAAFAAIIASAPVLAEAFKFDLAAETPANSIWADADRQFIEAVKEKSDGEIEITPHFGGALGYLARDHYTLVGEGAVPIASSQVDKFVGLAPIWQLSTVPFLTPGWTEARALYEAAKPHYEKALAEVNQILLYSAPGTPIGIWSKRPIANPDDLQGLKIRTFDANGTNTLRAAGAAPVQLSWAEVVPALSTNMIESVLTSDESGVNANFWEHMGYFHELNYLFGLSITHMNRDVFQSLSPEQQAIIMETAREVEEAAWQRAEERVAGNYEKIRSAGAQIVTDVPAEFVDHLKKAGEPMLETWRQVMGEAEADAILADFQAKLQR